MELYLACLRCVRDGDGHVRRGDDDDGGDGGDGRVLHGCGCCCGRGRVHG